MKRLLLVIGFITSTGFLALSQNIEITPIVGYQFGGQMNFYEGQFKGDGNLNYGLTVDIPLRDIVSLELYWSEMQTSYQWDSYDYGLATFEYDVNVHYFQVGSCKQDYLGSSDKVMGFGSLTMGAAWFDVQDEEIADVWRFAMTLGGGLKIFFSDRVGIRLQGRMLLPMYFGGSTYYVGMGGSGVSVSSYGCLVQGDFTGGLIIMVGK